jgi:outer membrane protein assembly factor BamD (BamD/ComL family)
MRFLRIMALLLCVFFIAGCGSGPANVSDTVTPAELVQWAQEASDRNRYKQALGYYEAILERFPGNNDYVCAAEYEIAFIHYKQKKYDLAESEFTDLLVRYDASDAELLPQQYKILATIVIARINERKK